MKTLLFHGVNDFLISEDHLPQREISHVKLCELLYITDIVTLESHLSITKTLYRHTLAIL